MCQTSNETTVYGERHQRKPKCTVPNIKEIYTHSVQSFQLIALAVALKYGFIMKQVYACAYNYIAWHAHLLIMYTCKEDLLNPSNVGVKLLDVQSNYVRVNL